ncbi:NUDIX domain-containing protein [Deinococcus fonticola]|uniref:NUDIX domain-containing protein n=1 Tax=Deinococcus fonticola TaxID=2528713 RepID=UPI001074E40A|nr:NUDIX domain-containing protein [Deinococcus fonticola]
MNPTHQVVCGIVLSEQRVLLGHRSARKQWYPNVWDFPGGHVEMGETPLAALQREMREELGIGVLHARPVREVALAEVHLTFWLVNRWEGKPTNLAPDEHDDLRWFALDDLRGLALADDFYPDLIAEALKLTL